MSICQWRDMYGPKYYYTCVNAMFMTRRYPVNNSDVVWYIFIYLPIISFIFQTIHCKSELNGELSQQVIEDSDVYFTKVNSL